jgi:hypothetical protein
MMLAERTLRKRVKCVTWYYGDNCNNPTHAIIVGTGEKVSVDANQLLVSVEGNLYSGCVLWAGAKFQMFDDCSLLSELVGQHNDGDHRVLFICLDAWKRLTYSDVKFLNANSFLTTIYIKMS